MKLFILFGFSFFVFSCKKERTCICDVVETTSALLYDGLIVEEEQIEYFQEAKKVNAFRKQAEITCKSSSEEYVTKIKQDPDPKWTGGDKITVKNCKLQGDRPFWM